MPIVYQATNRINGKRYIGVTKRALPRRRSSHHSDARRGTIRPFLNAIRKYGEEAFDWIILEERASVHAALDAEIRLIQALKPEYNYTKGGQGPRGLRHPPISRQKMSDSARSPKRLAMWERYRRLGPEASARAIICLDDGIIHPSAKAAARAYGVDDGQIIAICQGYRWRFTAGGKRFSYVNPTKDEHAACDARDKAKIRGRLRKEDVPEIKTLFLTMTVPEIVARYGVSRHTIYDVKSGRTWAEDSGLSA